jgi:hypothetical protein
VDEFVTVLSIPNCLLKKEQRFWWFWIKVLPATDSFLIGGKDKNFKQIAHLSVSYIFANDIESPVGAKLPLWMLGFLY